MRFSEIQKEFERIKEAFNGNNCVYVYGAGTYAELLLKCLLKENMKPVSILVSEKENKEVNGIPINQFQPNRKYDGILIMALASKYHDEIMKNVVGCFDEVMIFDDQFFRILKMSENLKICDKNGKWRKSNLTEIVKKNQSSKTIILQRGGGLGDILSLEPLCRALKKSGYRVGLMSNWDCLFSYNNSIDFSGPPTNQFLEDSALYISVEFAHETRPLHHMLDGYAEAVREYIPDIKIEREDRIPVYDNSLIRRRNGEIKKICINAEASEWKSRIYDLNKMREFAKYLSAKGYEIYEVGSDKSNYLGVGQDCFGLDLHDSVTLMSKTDLYVGVDNGLMHLAQAIRLPIFVLFGCTCPVYRIHDWTRARVMWKNVDVLNCAGCYHRRRIPCIKTVCMYDKCHCLDWSVEEVICAFEHLDYNNPPDIKEEMLKPIWA